MPRYDDITPPRPPFTTSTTSTKLDAALGDVQRAVGALHKDAANPHYRNRYVSLDAMTDALRDACVSAGLLIAHSATFATDSAYDISHGDGEYHGEASPPGHAPRHLIMTVATRVTHIESGEYIEATCPVVVAKHDPQGCGGAITYGRRYCLSMLFALTSEEDDDGNAASGISAGPPIRIPATAAPPKAPAPAPSAPRAGSGSATIPFGTSKGTLLSKLTERDLRGALDWAEKKGKFPDFQAEARAELIARKVLSDVGEAENNGENEDDLPF